MSANAQCPVFYDGLEPGGSGLPTVLPSSCSTQLNDTGFNVCSNGSETHLPCPILDFPRQDADEGRDAAASLGQLGKLGGGSAGFDLTKISNLGAILPSDAARGDEPHEWACTRDNVTGLYWEVKSSEGFRNATNRFRWFNPDSLTNGGKRGK
jgi:hypothetical protein